MTIIINYWESFEPPFIVLIKFDKKHFTQTVSIFCKFRVIAFYIKFYKNMTNNNFNILTIT